MLYLFETEEMLKIEQKAFVQLLIKRRTFLETPVTLNGSLDDVIKLSQVIVLLSMFKQALRRCW